MRGNSGSKRQPGKHAQARSYMYGGPRGSLAENRPFIREEGGTTRPSPSVSPHVSAPSTTPPPLGHGHQILSNFLLGGHVTKIPTPLAQRAPLCRMGMVVTLGGRCAKGGAGALHTFPPPEHSIFGTIWLKSRPLSGYAGPSFFLEAEKPSKCFGREPRTSAHQTMESLR